MKAITEKWKTVCFVAERLGVGNEALRKWRERGKVPGDWHIALIQHSNGRLSMSDFVSPATVRAET